MFESLPVTDVLIQFTLVITVALAIQFTLEHSRIPGIIGLLLIGMLIGPGGLAPIPEEPVIELLGTIGLLFIMFMAGLEVDLEIVRQHKRETATFGVLAAALTLAPAVAIALLMGLEWTGAMLVGAALASHTLVAYPIVERLGLVGRQPVVAAIGGTLLTDTFALVLLAILVQQPGEGGGSILEMVTPLLLLAALAGISLAVVPRIARRMLDDSKATLAEKALFLLVVLLILATLADAIGTEDILGAFLAGLCLNQPIRRRPELRDHIHFVGRMLFIPFFFVKTGMRLDLSVFAQMATWGFAAALLGAVAFGKSAAAWITGRLFGYGRMDRVVMIGLTLPQAAATLAVIVIGREMDLVSDLVEDAVIIVIFLTCLAGPLLTRYAGSRLAEPSPGPQGQPDRG